MHLAASGGGENELAFIIHVADAIMQGDSLYTAGISHTQTAGCLLN